MALQTLSQWLTLLEQTHVTAIDLSLIRMQKAAQALDLLDLQAPVITVAGTNGKGSVVCALETIYHTAGYRVASYTSPHLFVFNERVKINTQPLEDDAWCQAFAAVYSTAQQFQLTYFEVITLAAFWIFKQIKLDVIILEVGLGGRLDAVNVIDPSLAIITSIDLDHTDRLGSTRDAIATEKAGIFRKNTPVICGDLNPPPILKEMAEKLNAPFYQVIGIPAVRAEAPSLLTQRGDPGVDTNLDIKPRLPRCARNDGLIKNDLLPENMNTAVAAIMQLQTILPVSQDHINTGLENCHLPGRQQIIYNKCKHIIDVAHNPAGLKKLAERIEQERSTGSVLLVFSMLADKDLLSSFQILSDYIDEWYIAPLQNERAASLEQLQSASLRLHILSLRAQRGNLGADATHCSEPGLPRCARNDEVNNRNDKQFQFFTNVQQAYQAAFSKAKPDDLLIVAGSFYTVVEASLGNLMIKHAPPCGKFSADKLP